MFDQVADVGKPIIAPYLIIKMSDINSMLDRVPFMADCVGRFRDSKPPINAQHQNNRTYTQLRKPEWGSCSRLRLWRIA